MLNFFSSPTYNKIFKICFVLYILFAALLIARSSSVGIDGQRHFVLFDDAMISMRYADNLAHGNGLVWNIGEKVEGFTNPLMVFIMSVAIVIFGNNYSMLFIQLLGLACLATNIFLAHKIISRLLHSDEQKDFLKFIGLLLVMVWYPVMYWSVFGMETGYLTTLLLYIFYLSIYKDTQNKISIVVPILLSLVYLSRPEGILFIGIFLLFRLIQRWPIKKNMLPVVVEGLIAAVPIVGYQIFRVMYYGQRYPNTYILKVTGMSIDDRLKNGFGFYQPFIDRVEIFIGAVVIFFFIYAWKSGIPVKEKVKNIFVGSYRYVTMSVLLFMTYSAYQIWVGGDPWPPFWRMTVPYTVLFFLAFVVVLDELRKLFTIKADMFKALVSIIVFGFLMFIPYDYHFDFMRLEPYQTRNNAENINIALAIKEVTDSKATVASFWAGTIPYLSERMSFDPLGKTDAYIATLSPDVSGAVANPNRGLYSMPGHNKYDLNYTFVEKKPDVIIYMDVNGHYCAWGKQNLEEWCKRNYSLITHKGIRLLVKKNSSHVLWDNIK